MQKIAKTLKNIYNKLMTKTLHSAALKPLHIPEVKIDETLVNPYDNTKLEDSIKQLVKTIATGEIIEEMPIEHCVRSENSNLKDSLTPIHLHSLFMDLGYYARITKKVAKNFRKELPENSIILDPLAGRGYGVKALREAGIPVIGSDDGSWDSMTPGIEKLDALESLEKYGEEITHLLIAWAPYESEIDFELLEMCREKFPHIMIINIGESEGCTGGYKFSEAANIISYPDVEYRNVVSIHDYVSFIN